MLDALVSLPISFNLLLFNLIVVYRRNNGDIEAIPLIGEYVNVFIPL